jgi:hypothetical protein
VDTTIFLSELTASCPRPSRLANGAHALPLEASRNPDATKLLKDILYELHKGGEHPGANLDEIKHLIDLVRDFLRNKRYVPAISLCDVYEVVFLLLVRYLKFIIHALALAHEPSMI